MSSKHYDMENGIRPFDNPSYIDYDDVIRIPVVKTINNRNNNRNRVRELEEKIKGWREAAKEVDLDIIYLNETYAWESHMGEAVGRAWEKLFESQDKLRALMRDAAMDELVKEGQERGEHE